MLRTFLGLSATLLALSSTALTQTITLVHEGTSSGSLGGVPFAASDFRITCIADVGNRETGVVFVGYWIDHTSVSIDITGVGTVDITTPTRTFVNNAVSIVGFSRSTMGGLDLFNGPIDPAFSTWDMTTAIGPVTGSGQTLQWTMGDILTSGGVLDMNSNGGLPCIFTATVGPATLGTNYCGSNVNSTGQRARISAVGSALVANNDVTLEATDLPLNATGFFITSQTQGFVPNPAGSQGILCVIGMVGRYVGPGQIQNSGGSGSISLSIDLMQHPTPTGFVSVMPGQTWNFQSWYRDSLMGSATSNFSDGLEIAFQ
ncbi:MAG: hypothetical protein AAF957_18635 [Planctomycetota bacterium]